MNSKTKGKAGIKAQPARDEEMLAEYDFSRGVRGKYAKRMAEGSNLIVLSPDVAEFFPDSESVNVPLRSIADIARKTSRNRSIGLARPKRK
jgi:hypothetical protein